VSRTKPAAQRRGDLMMAGQQLFVAKGLAATTLEDITRGAGMSKGLFYQYFRSKEDLVGALQEQFSRELADQIRGAAAEHGDWGAKLDACAQLSFEWYRDRHELHEVLFRHAGHEAAPGHGDGYAPAIEALRELLDGGVAAGAFTVADTEPTAVLFYMVMHAFDPDSHGHRPAGGPLVRATQQLFRRAAGVAGEGDFMIPQDPVSPGAPNPA
jgi:TetR/AcrR family transcriptional regulator, transcriptional repressor for nem operon